MATTKGLSKKVAKLAKNISKAAQKNSRKIFIIAPIISLLLLGALVYNFKGAFVVAVVNNQPITRLDLDRELERQNGQSVLENMILRNLIAQEGKKKGVNVTKDDLNNRIAEIEKEFEAQGQSLDSYLAMSGQTRKDVEDQIQIQLTVEKILGDQVQVTEEETKDYFEKNKNLYEKGTTYESKKDEITETLKQQKLGEAFQSWIETIKSEADISYFKQF